MIQQSHLSFQLNWVAIGPQRTATTWLYKILENHSELCFPKGVKETFFFDERYSKDLAWYRAHFRHQQSHQYCCEIAPSYFDVEAVPKRLYAHNPDCRIVVTLRNPILRTWSLYRHHFAKGRVSGSFEEATEQMPRILTSGSYATHLPRWLNRFGSQQVKCLLLDDLHISLETTLKELCQFLGITVPNQIPNSQDKINSATTPVSPQLARIATQAASFLRFYRLHRLVELGKNLGLNRVYTGGEQKAPQLTPELQRKLLEYYEPDICFLENLLERDLTSWRQLQPIQTND